MSWSRSPSRGPTATEQSAEAGGPMGTARLSLSAKLTGSLKNASIFSKGMQPAASHAQSAHVCGLRRFFSDAHVAGKTDFISFRRLRTTELCEAHAEDWTHLYLFDKLKRAALVGTARFCVRPRRRGAGKWLTRGAAGTKIFLEWKKKASLRPGARTAPGREGARERSALS